MPVQAGLTPMLTAQQADDLLNTVFPQLNRHGRDYEVVEVSAGGCVVRLNASEHHMRPGATVSGPALFALADIGGYVCALSHAGPDALCVTTSLTINFLRKAGPGAILGYCRILKLGKRLMVFDADLVDAASGETIAHATGTYSIPGQTG